MSLHRNLRPSTQRINIEPGRLCFGESVSSDWFGEGQCLDLHCGFGVTTWSVTVSAALSGLTCSFCPLWVFCGGLLLPVQPLWLPLALDRPLFLFA